MNISKIIVLFISKLQNSNGPIDDNKGILKNQAFYLVLVGMCQALMLNTSKPLKLLCWRFFNHLRLFNHFICWGE
jgi:hypothetical protein